MRQVGCASLQASVLTSAGSSPLVALGYVHLLSSVFELYPNVLNRVQAQGVWWPLYYPHVIPFNQRMISRGTGPGSTKGTLTTIPADTVSQDGLPPHPAMAGSSENSNGARRRHLDPPLGPPLPLQCHSSYRHRTRVGGSPSSAVTPEGHAAQEVAVHAVIGRSDNDEDEGALGVTIKAPPDHQFHPGNLRRF
jgi:hypothetical protein